MYLKHSFHSEPGQPKLWISVSIRGRWYLFRELGERQRAKLPLSRLYAEALMRENDRWKAERLLVETFL